MPPSISVAMVQQYSANVLMLAQQKYSKFRGKIAWEKIQAEGAYYDRRLKDKTVKVTVIATGFNGAFASRRYDMPSLFQKQDRKDALLEEIYKEKKSEESKEEPATKEKQDKSKKISVKEETEDSWDIPAFLRKGKKEKK